MTLQYQEARMQPEERLELALRGTVEVIQKQELAKLLAEKEKPRAYWGFECSGKQLQAARNDAHWPRADLRHQDPGNDRRRLPFHDLPRRLSFDD